MKDIAAAILEKRMLLLKVKQDIKVLELAKALLDAHPGTSARGKGGKRERGTVSPDSEAGIALAILREEGAPLHVDLILKRMKKRGRNATKASISSTLARWSKKGKIFYRAGQPNTFGLLEWPERPGMTYSATTKI